MNHLVGLLENSAKKFSWRKCLISDNAAYSFHRLSRESSRLAFALKEKLGIKKGDRVAILMKNSPEFIIAFFAILKTGAVCVPLNIFLTFKELKYILKDCRTRLLISSSEFLNVLDEALPEKQKGINDLLNLERVILTDKKTDKFLYWQELLKDLPHSCGDGHLDIKPDDLAVLIYTSGTTGLPKGVMLSHNNLYSNVIASLQDLEITHRDRFLLILPMFHSFTLTVCILVPICAGARIIIIKSVKPFQKVLRSILLNRITIVVGIPHLYDILKNLALPPILQQLLRVKLCISGAAPLSPQTLEAFNEKFKKISLLEGYGLTEASPVVSLNPLRGVRKVGSIGLPVPGVKVKVVREDESEAATEEIGELIVNGPNVMLGYLNLPEETKKVIKGGWLFTGDMARIDSDKYIYIAGRKKEMIITHGMNIYPLEIENVLKLHPKIKEVAVVGKKDKSRGEVPVAFIVLRKDCSAQDREIIDYCKGRLANYKIPRWIEFREDLPKTPTGKILKRKLAEAEGGCTDAKE
jgi:long-chain acyl-CoA synthetase